MDKTKKKEFLLSKTHYLIGFSLLVKGYAKWEHYPHQTAKVFVIFLAGLLMIVGAALHHKISKKFKRFTGLFNLFEGLALIMIGLIFFEEGSRRIPYILFFLGVSYLVIGFTFFFTKEKNKDKVFDYLQLGMGITFLAAGLTALILNLISDKNFWLYVISLLFFAAGSIMIIKKWRHKKARIFSGEK
ncbi:MAG: DUF308 domain-containing protein [Candidatus Aminicenantes bacterium]|nr:DUF308 domain-containing protein [Candidatus Aminicenantes bacterium]